MDVFYCLIVIASVLQISTQIEDGKGKEYKAAVVEYNPSPILRVNILQYVIFIKTASQDSSCDIVIFPEAALTVRKKGSLVPDPEDKVIPYKNETYKNYKAVTAISEAAAKHKIYVVVNLYEVVNCTNATTDCPKRGYFLYNTNVAFDRNGTVVARYRKINLFDEDGINKPQPAELSTFTTDFGVTFGMFICFDILFKTPAIDLVQKKNVTNLIFSTFWFGELPFLTAAQIQSGWSYAMNVNLLASGANSPEDGTSGSGIYYGQRDKISYMFEKPMSVMIVGEARARNKTTWIVSCVSGDSREDTALRLLEDPSIKASNGENLDPEAKKFENKICHNELCCRFSAEYRKASDTNSSNYTYRAVAFRGERPFGKSTTGETTYCALLLCTDGNCAKKPANGDYPLIFDKIKIDGDFDGKNSFQMPNTLVWSDERKRKMLLRTMDYERFAYEREETDGNGTVNLRIQLKKGNVANLLTFGIFGRKFK